jgi:hypothetical protein
MVQDLYIEKICVVVNNKPYVKKRDLSVGTGYFYILSN